MYIDVLDRLIKLISVLCRFDVVHVYNVAFDVTYCRLINNAPFCNVMITIYLNVCHYQVVENALHK